MPPFRSRRAGRRQAEATSDRRTLADDVAERGIAIEAHALDRSVRSLAVKVASMTFQKISTWRRYVERL
jgi:hypothetical protein